MKTKHICNRIGGMFAEATATPLDVILQQVSWYWYTKSYGRALWPYHSAWEAILRDVQNKLPSPLAITNKPLGYSWFPTEPLAVAKSWMEHWFPENLVFYRAHEKVRRVFPTYPRVVLLIIQTRVGILRSSTSPRTSCRI